jgi:hypothetical protein
MAKVRIQLTRNGPRELRRLPAVQADMLQRAKQVAAAAGPGMEATSFLGRNRARASVITATREARWAEATDRALTRAIGASSGSVLRPYKTKSGKTIMATPAQIANWRRGW